MGQTKPELSKKNKYWISKEKYYELLHFCRQYSEYRQELQDILTMYPDLSYRVAVTDDKDVHLMDKILMSSEKLREKIALIEQTAKEAEPDLYHWLLIGVTTDYSYGYLSIKLGMPASKDMYYDRYRKFFYLLAQKR